MPQKPKQPNPFFRRIKSLDEIKGPTDDEVSELLWGRKEGPSQQQMQEAELERRKGAKDGKL